MDRYFQIIRFCKIGINTRTVQIIATTLKPKQGLVDDFKESTIGSKNFNENEEISMINVNLICSEETHIS